MCFSVAFAEEVGGDTSGFVDGGQAGAGMGAAADKVEVLVSLHSVVGAEDEHLVEGVG